MHKPQLWLTAAFTCVLLVAATPLWAAGEKANLPEGNINIETSTRHKGLKVVSMVKPLYPPEAKAKGVEGLVKIDVTIDKEGKVIEASPLSGPDLLKASALEAVRQWRYEPLGVEVKATINVNYKLASKAKPAPPNTKP